MNEKVRPLPAKLIRLRRAKSALTAQSESLRERYSSLAAERRRARAHLESVERAKLNYGTDVFGADSREKEQQARELKASREAVENLEAMMADIDSERAEIRADLDPVRRTVRSLEEHLGVSEFDEYLPAHLSQRVTDKRGFTS